LCFLRLHPPSNTSYQTDEREHQKDERAHQKDERAHQKDERSHQKDERALSESKFKKVSSPLFPHSILFSSL
jgi:hypothetical protein